MLNDLGIDEEINFRFLDIGFDDINMLQKVCKKYKMPTPTEMKLFYNVKTHKFDADYCYEEKCTADTGLSSHEVFEEWMEEVEQSK